MYFVPHPVKMATTYHKSVYSYRSTSPTNAILHGSEVCNDSLWNDKTDTPNMPQNSPTAGQIKKISGGACPQTPLDGPWRSCTPLKNILVTGLTWIFPFVLSITIPVACTLCRDCSHTFVSKYSVIFAGKAYHTFQPLCRDCCNTFVLKYSDCFLFLWCTVYWYTGPSPLSCIIGRYMTTPKKDSCLSYFCNIAKNST